MVRWCEHFLAHSQEFTGADWTSALHKEAWVAGKPWNHPSPQGTSEPTRDTTEMRNRSGNKSLWNQRPCCEEQNITAGGHQPAACQEASPVAICLPGVTARTCPSAEMLRAVALGWIQTLLEVLTWLRRKWMTIDGFICDCSASLGVKKFLDWF